MGSKEVKISMKVYIMRVGLGVVPGEQSFFHEKEQNDQEQSHRSEKRTNAKNAFLKILERFVKEQNGTERNKNCLKRTFKIRNTFLLSRTCSKSGTHFKSGMCFKSSRNN